MASASFLSPREKVKKAMEQTLHHIGFHVETFDNLSGTIKAIPNKDVKLGFDEVHATIIANSENTRTSVNIRCIRSFFKRFNFFYNIRKQEEVLMDKLKTEMQ